MTDHAELIRDAKEAIHRNEMGEPWPRVETRFLINDLVDALEGRYVERTHSEADAEMIAAAIIDVVRNTRPKT